MSEIKFKKGQRVKVTDATGLRESLGATAVVLKDFAADDDFVQVAWDQKTAFLNDGGYWDWRFEAVPDEPAQALKHLDLHVPMSADGRTTFAEAADILDHIATVYAWHPDVYGFFLTRALQARQIDSVYEQGPDAAYQEGSRRT